MKFLVILFSLTALTWAQDQPHCRCGGFITESEEEVEVFNLPTFQVENCEADQGCRELCREIWVRNTNDGSLDNETGDGQTVGQTSCDALAARGDEDFGPKEVVLYSKLCDGAWEMREESSNEELCCKGGQYVTCM